jgi:hypothetical protein
VLQRRAVILVLAGLAVVVAACTKTTEINTPTGSHNSLSGGGTATTKPVAHTGATLSLDSGAETVTLVRVIDQAHGANDAFTPDPGKRFVAAAFTIKNAGAQAGSGDANNNASVIGSDNQTYTAAFDQVSECTDFQDGQFQLGAGESVTGCVVFLVPNGISVMKVKWSPNSGFASDFGEWVNP